MSDTKKDGGPAFPRQGRSPLDDVHAGMSPRDYFAAKAMQSLVLAGEQHWWRLSDAKVETSDNDRVSNMMEEIAIEAYAIADAMLKARAPLIPDIQRT